MRNCQIKFNSYLNYYFDNKTILNQTTENYNKETIYGAKKLCKYFQRNTIVNNSFSKYELKISKKFNNNKIIKNLKLITSKNTFLKKSLAFFLVHGSYASNDFIEQWSDVDTFVVIKNNVFLKYKNIIKLRKEIKNLYSYFYKVCRFQHHGLILFTESDLENYLDSYLPVEALSPAVKIFGKNKIKFRLCNSKRNHFLEKLKTRLVDFKVAKKLGIYKHHAKNFIYLEYPLKKDSEQMFQLHSVINYVISLPAYFLSAIKNSVNKKYSFSKFYKIIKNKKIKKTIENSRIIRRKWKPIKNDKIPLWVIKKLGDSYFDEIVYSIEFIINKIKKYKF